MDIGYEPSQELRESLRPVFNHYCGFGEKDNYTYMSRAQFLKFARDCQLVYDHLDLIAVNLIFDQLNATSAVMGENTKRLSFHEFLGALGSLALAMYDEISLDISGVVDSLEGEAASLGFVQSQSSTSPRSTNGRDAGPAALSLNEEKSGASMRESVAATGGGVSFAASIDRDEPYTSSEGVSGGDNIGALSAESPEVSRTTLTGAPAGARTPGSGIRTNNLRNSIRISESQGGSGAGLGLGPGIGLSLDSGHKSSPSSPVEEHIEPSSPRGRSPSPAVKASGSSRGLGAPGVIALKLPSCNGGGVEVSFDAGADGDHSLDNIHPLRAAQSISSCSPHTSPRTARFSVGASLSRQVAGHRKLSTLTGQGQKGSLRQSGDTITAAAAVQLMVEECVLPRAAAVPAHASDALGDVIATPEVLEYLALHTSALRQIFKFYSCVEEPVGVGRELRWDDVQKCRAVMSQYEWQKFVQDFHLLPDIMSKVQIAASFREANFGGRSTSDITRAELTFPEFEDCIARCALRAYGYKIPPSPEVAKTYHAQVVFEPAAMRVKVQNTSATEASRMFREGDGWGSPPPMNVSPTHAVRVSTGRGGPRAEDSFLLFREREYIYKETHAPGTRPVAFPREYPQLYCPLAGLPAVYHRTMVDMVSARERQDEGAERARKGGILAARDAGRTLMRGRKTQRETLESRAGAGTMGATGRSSVSPDGRVRNLSRDKTPLMVTMRNAEPYLPHTDINNGSRRRAGGESVGVHYGKTVRGGESNLGSETGLVSWPVSTSASELVSIFPSKSTAPIYTASCSRPLFDLHSVTDFPDIHSSYHAKSRMPNVLTVKRLDGGRFVPINKAAIKVREGTGTVRFSMGDRSVH
mmetsp:Transcript_10338/g.25387  ORF Transcript_10338/g.25387 Transcript_10338/m.25387 type:complete len:868 (+) Transcript_10338:126-2729(+)